MNDDGRSDAELVRRVRQGERDAFGPLYDRYARLVRVIASDGGADESAVQDRMQETFMRAYRKLDTLLDADRFGPWLAAIARQVGLESRRNRTYMPLPDDVPAADSACNAIEAADEIATLRRRIAGLPENEREAVRLFFLCERNADETARLLGFSRSGVYALLKRACRTLAVRSEATS